jgi:hypothetical protein
VDRLSHFIHSLKPGIVERTDTHNQQRKSIDKRVLTHRERQGDRERDFLLLLFIYFCFRFLFIFLLAKLGLCFSVLRAKFSGKMAILAEFED